MAENMNHLEDLMLGNVSEEVSESQEALQARIAEAQKRIQQVRKEESSQRVFDKHLAQLITGLPPAYLALVAFLIDEEIPSLTILALLGLTIPQAGTIAFHALSPSQEAPRLPSSKNLPPKVFQKLYYWALLLKKADKASSLNTLQQLMQQPQKAATFQKGVQKLLEDFITLHRLEMTPKDLLCLLKPYEKELFALPA